MWVLNYLSKRRIDKFLDEFPNALDVIVRGIKSGLPVNDCLRIIAAESKEPVRSEFRGIVDLLSAGLTLGQAVDRIAERIAVSETSFFSIVINIQQTSGGSLSEALSNLSRVLRDRKKMHAKIQAMASEAKASAMIIGSLPFAVGTMVYLSSPKYIELLWTTTVGQVTLGGAALWMGAGIFVMKKMISFDV
jgi:tight adherence protein B